MKRFTLEFIGYATFTLGFLLVVGTNITHCSTPAPMSEYHLPAEKNFEPLEKIWTEEDFRQAEAHPADINYYQLCQTACPDNLTADDLAQIEKHHRTQMQKLTVGVGQ